MTDWEKVTEVLRKAQDAKRKPNGRLRGTSVLDEHRKEIVALREQGGASLAQIKLWLAAYKGLEIERSTIMRRFKKWGVD